MNKLSKELEKSLQKLNTTFNKLAIKLTEILNTLFEGILESLQDKEIDANLLELIEE